jgi:superfamily I DNA/RNA helicase
MPESTQSAKFDQIASNQAKAVKISGGSGSGKTLALAKRVDYLLRQRTVAGQIAVFVPTRNAANEFTGKSNPPKQVFVGTVKDFCLSVLGTSEAITATGRVPRILTDFEYRILLEDLKTLGYKPKLLRDILDFILRSWTQLDDLQKGFIANEGEQMLLDALRAALLSRKAILGEEVSNIAYRYLSENEGARTRYAKAHALVDDYHCLSKSSQAVVDLLALQTLTVTGSNNEWTRSAESYPYAGGFSEFTRNHSGTEEYLLTRNIRCAQGIAACGNALILNSDMDRRNLTASSPDDTQGHVRLVKSP